jgi:hypothetical protein
MNNSSKFDLLPLYVDNITNRKVVYIGPDGSSGYACAAKGYIYELIRTNVPVKFLSYTIPNQQIDIDNTPFSFLINKKKILYWTIQLKLLFMQFQKDGTF